MKTDNEPTICKAVPMSNSDVEALTYIRKLQKEIDQLKADIIELVELGTDQVVSEKIEKLKAEIDKLKAENKNLRNCFNCDKSYFCEGKFKDACFNEHLGRWEVKRENI